LFFFNLFFFKKINYVGGNTLGFSSMIALFPESDLVIASLTNTYVARYPNVVYYYLADEILNLPRTQDWTQTALTMTERDFNGTAEARRGNFPPRQKNSHAAHPLNEYSGTYTHPLFAGDMTITVKDNHLVFHFTTFVARMEHYHFESFNFLLDMWSVKTAQLVTFLTGQDGKVSGVEFEYNDQKWTFEKKKDDAKVQEGQGNIHETEEEEERAELEEDQEESFEQSTDSLQFKLLKMF